MDELGDVRLVYRYLWVSVRGPVYIFDASALRIDGARPIFFRFDSETHLLSRPLVWRIGTLSPLGFRHAKFINSELRGVSKGVSDKSFFTSPLQR